MAKVHGRGKMMLEIYTDMTNLALPLRLEWGVSFMSIHLLCWEFIWWRTEHYEL